MLAEHDGPSLPAAVLWDMDGTIVDTEPYWIAAEYAVVERYGGTWSQELAHQLVGRALTSAAEFIRAHSPVPLGVTELIETMQGMVIEQVRRQVPWRPGAVELLADLGRHDVPTALVTMSWRPLADAVIEALPPGTFAAVVTGEIVTRGKPHPDPYLLAAELLEVDPRRCVAIEDSPSGVASAVAAGVPTIAVPHIVPVPASPGATPWPTLAGLAASDLVDVAAGRSVSLR